MHGQREYHMSRDGMLSRGKYWMTCSAANETFNSRRCTSDLGRFQNYSDCLYKQRLNVFFGRKQTFPTIFSPSPQKCKGHPEGWPMRVAAIEDENLGRIRCH